MSSKDDQTLGFYAEEASAYAGRDRLAEHRRIDPFVAKLKPGARVLELGCGGGQDSAYMLGKGFDVTPTDGSAELARQAEKLIGRPVTVMRFQDLQATGEFDGVWAEASLLHVPRAELPDVFSRIHSALKPGAPLHASFKAGEAEGHDGFGRYYNYPSPDWLSQCLTAGGWRDIALSEADGGGYDGKPTRWLFLTVRK